MENIRNLTIEELENLMVDFGEQKFRAKQIFMGLHKHKIEDFDSISNISLSLKEKIGKIFDVSYLHIDREFVSKIDDTKKYLIALDDGYLIESVLMKYKYGYTVCISTEVGCNMGCKFCASTIGGMKRNLQAHELLGQIYLIEKKNNIDVGNVVLMGSGEPLVNFDNVVKFLYLINAKDGKNLGLRNITISTCGIVPAIKRLADMNFPITLALSLHAPNDEIRRKIMPIAERYNLDETLMAMVYYYKMTRRRITFEYSLINNVNDGENNAYLLSRLLNKYIAAFDVDFNVNLIPVNEVVENRFKRPNRKRLEVFKEVLEKNYINCTIRRELGSDISGSCGQLRAGVK